MCMKYINATVSCYNSVVMLDNNIVSLNIPFDTITAETNEEGTVAIGEFFVVSHINLLGTDKEDNINSSTLAKKEKLDVIIRFTKCDKDEDKQRYTDLDSFTIDFSNDDIKENIHRACFEYFNYKRVTKIEPLKLPLGAGSYVIKILVKESSGDKYTVQAMSNLYVSA